jgi:hypothetical protein
VSIAEFSRGTGSYVRSAVASFLRVGELDVGMLEAASELVIYARTDKSWRPTALEWRGFCNVHFPVPVRAHLFFIPVDTASEFGEEVARRVYVAATGRGFVCAVEQAAFALGGAQAVADLVLSEQRERQPAERVPPA